jgi:hypothetical protein
VDGCCLGHGFDCLEARSPTVPERRHVARLSRGSCALSAEDTCDRLRDPRKALGRSTMDRRKESTYDGMCQPGSQRGGVRVHVSGLLAKGNVLRMLEVPPRAPRVAGLLFPAGCRTYLRSIVPAICRVVQGRVTIWDDVRGIQAPL